MPAAQRGTLNSSLLSSFFQRQPNRRVIFFPPWWLYSNPYGNYGFSPFYNSSYFGYGYGPPLWDSGYAGMGGGNYYQGESEDYQGPTYRDFQNTAPPPPSASDVRPMPGSIVVSLDGRDQPATQASGPVVIGSGIHTLRISGHATH